MQPETVISLCRWIRRGRGLVKNWSSIELKAFPADSYTPDMVQPTAEGIGSIRWVPLTLTLGGTENNANSA
jgi:hypothetical protein